MDIYQWSITAIWLPFSLSFDNPRWRQRHSPHVTLFFFWFLFFLAVACVCWPMGSPLIISMYSLAHSTGTDGCLYLVRDISQGYSDEKEGETPMTAFSWVLLSCFMWHHSFFIPWSVVSKMLKCHLLCKWCPYHSSQSKPLLIARMRTDLKQRGSSGS